MIWLEKQEKKQEERHQQQITTGFSGERNLNPDLDLCKNFKSNKRKEENKLCPRTFKVFGNSL